MPIHDWTRVDSGLFHAIHQSWITHLSDGLNSNCLPADYYALAAQRDPIPDRPNLIISSGECEEIETELYSRLADRIVGRHRHGNVVAVVEIISRGNKASQMEFRAFVEKAANSLRKNVNLLIVDLFPPGKRDPQGIHKAIWDEIEEEDFELLPDKPLTLAACDANNEITAYVEPVGVGDVIPDMPLFLRPDIYVPTPLEETYQTTWELFPRHLKGLLEMPAASASSNGQTP